MTNYSSWAKRKINTTSLRLDISNPRLSDTTKKLNQNEIIEYLVENEKVYDLALSIISNGYFLNEQPIILKEGGKYHVLEGNRRVAACKILINPDLIKSSVRKNRIKELLKNYDLNNILKLECIISPSREDADVMIINRHTGGSSVEKWDKTKQDRFLYNRFTLGETIEEMAKKLPISKAEIKNSLKRYNVYKELSNLDINESINKALLDETTFNMTNVERAYQFKEGMEFMGFEFDENNFTLVKKLPKEEFEKRMSKIAIDVIEGRINSRKLNNEKDKTKYFEELWNSGNFDSTIVPSTSYNETKETDSEEIKPQENKEKKDDIKKKKQKVSLTKIMEANVFLESGINRIDEIFYELKSLNVKNNPNSVAVLFRSYLDMLSYQFLKQTKGLESLKIEMIEKYKIENDKKFVKIKKSLSKLPLSFPEDISDSELRKALGIDVIERSSFVPSLKFMLSHIANSPILIDDSKLKQALQGYVRNDLKILGHNDFNLLVHNEYYTADPEELKKVWNQMYPILEYFVTQLKK
ncbi:hypothetical protein HX079_11575 [Myroides odoratimimus]|uniref:ParB/RepB/Spo0J family partition protein n=1 Tax=Myroides odoratimimus TaxID=76832 RepID=UPI0025777856|nr:ParB/Srx family N-terminal domain-containing protein [Myroides odoratimimus]MDM1506451.1 hypothetical protein [Myroides odoratimimus]